MRTLSSLNTCITWPSIGPGELAVIGKSPRRFSVAPPVER
jgi:hypothetical protein